MKICIFGAASPRIDKSYTDIVEQLGERLAKRGHSLVFGAGSTGLMGAAARGFKRGGGRVHGVIPEFFKEHDVEEIFTDCDELIFTQTMSERKRIMEDCADAYIVVPGGIGTFEEFFEVLTLKQLGRHAKAIALFNIAGYYDDMCRLLEKSAERKFITFDCRELYATFTDIDGVIKYLDSYVPEIVSWRKFKVGDNND